jgi:NAD(P)-dependent dehydrogenase (short-subunit alcohol dehydrogenase family)
MELEGKVAVITGAASGMGRAMAELFTAEGAMVVAADWQQESLDAAVAEIAAGGAKIVGIQGDVSKQEQAEAFVNKAVEAFGKLDILCNNAGVMDTNMGVGELTNEMWERVLGIDLNGPMFCSRRAVPIMLGQGSGVILNTASIAGLGGAAAGAAYTAAKHGLIGLTENTAWRYALEGIRCNAIAAGAVQTNIMQSVDASKMDPGGIARSQTYYALIPAQLEAVDIANLALFLVSDRARYINGATVIADGGWRSA